MVCVLLVMVFAVQRPVGGSSHGPLRPHAGQTRARLAPAYMLDTRSRRGGRYWPLPGGADPGANYGLALPVNREDLETIMTERLVDVLDSSDILPDRHQIKRVIGIKPVSVDKSLEESRMGRQRLVDCVRADPSSV